MAKANLRDRCKAQYQRMTQNAILRTGDPVEDLTAFVMAEIGKAADSRLDDAEPLVLYFSDPKEREEFVALIMEAKPGMVSKKWP